MEDKKSNNIDMSWKGVYKVGGISLFVAGAIPFIFLMIVIVTQQTIPVPAKKALENPTIPTNLYLLATLGELLLLPAGLALYLSLKEVKRT